MNDGAPEGWAEIVAVADEHGDSVSLTVAWWSHEHGGWPRHETTERRVWSTRLALHLDAASMAAALAEYRALWASPELEEHLARADAWRAEHLARADAWRAEIERSRLQEAAE